MWHGQSATKNAWAEHDEKNSCLEQRISCKIEEKGSGSPAGETLGRKTG